MSENLTILNIGCHPKDAIIYSGGTVAKHSARGDRVCILTTTTGVALHLRAIEEYKNTGSVSDIDSLIDDKKRELVEAANELGVSDVRFLGYDDEIVLPTPKIVSDIADVIGEINPNIIITHWPYDSVPAHAATAQMTLLAIDAASGIRKGKPYSPTGGDTGGEQAQIFYHSHPGRTNVLENLAIRMPTTVIDITDVVQNKSNAMNKFKSQDYGEDRPLQRKFGEALDGSHYSIHALVPYSEAFVAHNAEVYEYLPLSDYRRKLFNMSSEEILNYQTQILL